MALSVPGNAERSVIPYSSLEQKRPYSASSSLTVPFDNTAGDSSNIIMVALYSPFTFSFHVNHVRDTGAFERNGYTASRLSDILLDVKGRAEDHLSNTLQDMQHEEHTLKFVDNGYMLGMDGFLISSNYGPAFLDKRNQWAKDKTYQFQEKVEQLTLDALAKAPNVKIPCKNIISLVPRDVPCVISFNPETGNVGIERAY